MKGIVLFSDFLNLNEQNIYHSIERELYTTAELSGGYEQAERQLVAFLPDALSYEWEYPIQCLEIQPAYPKFAESLNHRDILGALMSLGIERKLLGDILCSGSTYYLFCEERITSVIMEQLQQIRHTVVRIAPLENAESLHFEPQYEVIEDMVASNRLDAIIAKAYGFSRSEAAQILIEDKVFVNGKCISNCNYSCGSGDIVSVRGKGRFLFETNQTLSKKGKLRVVFKKFK